MREAKLVWLNGEYVPWGDARVHVWTHALHYGSSVFEGIRGYWNGKRILVFRLKEHLERLVNSAKIYFMDPGYSVNELSSAIINLIKKNGFKENIYVRPLVFRDYGVIGLNVLECPVSTALIATPFGKYLDTSKGQRVMISSWRRISHSALPVKAKAGGNYINSILAKVEAVSNGYDEALMLDEHGFVCEGSAENFFIVKNEEVITPPVYSPILEGITRNTIITLAREKGFSVVERPISRGEVYTCDEAFFTGTAGEVAGVTSVDNRVIGDGVIGRVTRKLQQAYFDTVLGKNQKHQEWITEITME